MAEPTDIAGVPVLEASEFVLEFRGEGSEEADIVALGGSGFLFGIYWSSKDLIGCVSLEGWLNAFWKLPCER